MAEPAGDLSVAARASFTQLSDGTRVAVSKTTSVLAGGYRFLSQSFVSFKVTGALEETAVFVAATLALKRFTDVESMALSRCCAAGEINGCFHSCGSNLALSAAATSARSTG